MTKNNASNNVNNNDTPSTTPPMPSNPENKVDVKAIQKTHQRRVLRKHFKSFIVFFTRFFKIIIYSFYIRRSGIMNTS